jgi:hypothetical protein
VATTNAPSKIVPTDPTELRKVLERAQRGDESTLPVLREMLKQPHMIEACGNLAAHAEHTLIRKFAGKDLAVSEGVRRKLDSLRAELAGPAPTPLERLLVERIAICWLHLHHLEMIYASKESMALELGAYYQRSISAAQKRYLSAIKTLATVRRLALPVLIGQVNIAGKQVNKVAMSGPDGQSAATSPGGPAASGNERK